MFALILPVCLLLAASPLVVGTPRPLRQPPSPTTALSADDALAAHGRMLQALAEIRQHDDEHPYFSTARYRELLSKLEALPERARPQERISILHPLGQIELNLGRTEEAIEHLEAAFALIPERNRELRNRVAFDLGVANLRVGETQNCCATFSAESCILPLRGGALHTRPEGSRRAMEHFSHVLTNTQTGEGVSLVSRWLLNLAAMTLGEHPEGVAPEHLIPPERYRPAAGFPRFENVASEVGLDSFSLSGGLVVDDLDGDGRLDILTSSWDVATPTRFFHNAGDGGFPERTSEAGLDGLYGGLNMLQADADEDGDPDVLILRGAWLGAQGRHPNSLLSNDGRGHFSDVSFAVGLAEESFPTQTAAWGDVDNDGDLDLFVGNESSKELEAPCQLFENAGDGTFTDVAPRAGLDRRGFPKGTSFGDYDEDGFVDLYVSEYSGPNRLFHNEGDGTFTDRAAWAGVDGPHRSFPTWFWDFDNDGHLDLFAASYSGRIEHVAAHHVGLPPRHELPGLYRGDGRGGFTQVARERGLTYPMLPMGANFGDLDGDGFLDFYLGTGDPLLGSLMPNLMYVNRGSRFVDVSLPGGFGHLQKGHAVAFADLDNDGDLDVLEQMGGAYRGDEFRDALYENPGFAHAWVAVECVGTESNRSAIGARLHLRVSEDGRERSIYRHVSSGGSFGAGPLRQTIGLGRAERILSLEIRWPATGSIQTFEKVPLGRHLRATEGREELESRELQRFPLTRH